MGVTGGTSWWALLWVGSSCGCYWWDLLVGVTEGGTSWWVVHTGILIEQQALLQVGLPGVRYYGWDFLVYVIVGETSGSHY